MAGSVFPSETLEAEWSSLVARLPHKQKAACSNHASATKPPSEEHDVRPCLQPGCGRLTPTGSRCPEHRIRRDPNLARSMLDTVYLRDGGICWIGSHPVRRRDATLDHVIPLSANGGNDLNNLRLACRTHNSSRGDR